MNCPLTVRAIRLALVVAALIVFSDIGVRGQHGDGRSDRRVGRHAHLSADLTRHMARRTHARQRVIVHGTDRELELLASRHRLRVVRRMRGAAVVLANSAELGDLSRDGAVDRLSGDLPVHTSTGISDASTAADQTRAGNSVLGEMLGIPGVDGQGIGIAVVDSGIAPHSALAGRVVANVSFLSGDAQVADAFGHGTHVAGIIAGNPAPANGVAPDYAGGIAPRARLVNVRVLGADGSGLTSDVIAGIEWVVANRGALQHPHHQPVARPSGDGSVRERSAVRSRQPGGAGRDRRRRFRRQRRQDVRRPRHPGWHFVARELSLCDHGWRAEHVGNGRSIRRYRGGVQLARSDGVRPGGEAGHCRARHEDPLAAGRRRVPADDVSVDSCRRQRRQRLHVSDRDQHVCPMVSGGIALLLQGSPNLSPAQVKFALQNGATAMTDAGLMGAGAGSVNFWASRQIAVYGASAPSPLVAPALGAARSFAVLGAATVTNTGASIIAGDLGVSPGTAVTGFPPGQILSGTIHSADAAALAAQNDVTNAYNSLVGMACTEDLTGRDLGGQTLTAGVYCFSSSAQLTGTLTLNAQGNANAVFIFKMGSTITTASAATVLLTNGGSADNVFWQVGSSATLGTGTSFAGNILAMASITVTTGVRLTGRALARSGAVTLDTNAVTAPSQSSSTVTTTVGGAQTTGSGISFWDIGTLAARLGAGIGTRALSAVEASLVWANPSYLVFGDLNLLGLTNPIAAAAPKSLLWGEVASWTSANYIIWGSSLYSPEGEYHSSGARVGRRQVRRLKTPTSSGAARCSSRLTPAERHDFNLAGAREVGGTITDCAAPVRPARWSRTGGLAILHSMAALPRASHPLEWMVFALPGARH